MLGLPARGLRAPAKKACDCMAPSISSNFVRDTAVAAVVAVLGAAIVKFADLPTRVSVVETSQSDIKETVKSIDGKLDVLLGRTR